MMGTPSVTRYDFTTPLTLSLVLVLVKNGSENAGESCCCCCSVVVVGISRYPVVRACSVGQLAWLCKAAMTSSAVRRSVGMGTAMRNECEMRVKGEQEAVHDERNDVDIIIIVLYGIIERYFKYSMQSTDRR